MGKGEVEKPKLRPSLTFSYDGPGVTVTTPGKNLAERRESQADELGRGTKLSFLDGWSNAELREVPTQPYGFTSCGP